jgi:hypothetical protein
MTEDPSDWGTSWIQWCIQTAGGLEPGVALFQEGCLVLGVVGAMLAGWGLAGRRGAWAAGLLGGAWAYVQINCLLVSFDGFAWALGSLALGLALTGSRTGGPGLALVVAAGVIGALSGAVKETGLPVLVLLLASPLVARSPGRALAAAAALGLGLWLGVDAYLPSIGLPGQGERQLAHVSGLPEPSWVLAQAGLEQAWLEVHASRWTLIGQLTQLAALALVLPSKRWPARLALGGLALVATGLAAAHAGDKLDARHLLVCAWPLVILAGVALAQLGRVLQPLRPLWLVVPAGVTVGVVYDTLDHAHAYSAARTEYVGSDPSTLPLPPAGWQGRNTQINTGDARATGIAAGAALVHVLEDLPPAGVVVPVLRDQRQNHALLPGLAAGVPVGSLDMQKCCQGGVSSTCALAVVTAVDHAGAVMVLPSGGFGDPRLQSSDTPQWVGALKGAARSLGTLSTPDPGWHLFQGAGSGGPLPCQDKWERVK